MVHRALLALDLWSSYGFQGLGCMKQQQLIDLLYLGSNPWEAGYRRQAMHGHWSLTGTSTRNGEKGMNAHYHAILFTQVV